jgi:ubiquitin carboxyl-terminal hydrolase 25/28
MKVAMAASEGEVGLQEIEKAYKYLALDPDTREGDDYIIGVFNSRIEAAPLQKDEARDCLRVIAKARASAKIEAVANDRAMTFEEALSFLNVTEDTHSDSIEAAAVAMVSHPFDLTLASVS